MSALLDLINARKASLSKAKTLTVPTGRSRYRLLPSWRGEDQQFWMDYGQHFVKDATGQIKAVYVCEDKTFGRPCSVCDAVAHGIVNSTDDLTKARLEDARASARVLLNVLHLDGPTPNTVQILAVPPSVFNGKKGAGGIISLFQDWPNLIGGDDIIIEKAGQGKQDTSYAVSAIPGKPIDKSVWGGKLHNLDQYVASENEQSKQRALASVGAISGFLPAAVANMPRIAAPAAVPTAGSYSIDDEEDALRTIEQQGATPAANAPTVAAAPDDLEAYLKDL